MHLQRKLIPQCELLLNLSPLIYALFACQQLGLWLLHCLFTLLLFLRILNTAMYKEGNDQQIITALSLLPAVNRNTAVPADVWIHEHALQIHLILRFFFLLPVPASLKPMVPTSKRKINFQNRYQYLPVVDVLCDLVHMTEITELPIVLFPKLWGKGWGHKCMLPIEQHVRTSHQFYL